MPEVLDVVRPAHLWVPERRGSYVDEVRDVAELLGRPLDAEQELAVDAKTSYGPGGRWLALETGLLMGRQSGKTAGVETPIVLADLFLWGADRIAWTAHLFKTAREAFEDHVRLIQSTPEFDRRVARIRYANGEEGIELVTGARLDYLARSKGGGRGLGGKRVVLDEALFLTPEQSGAILPILAAREDPQIDYLSSACKVESHQLRALAKRGRAGGDPSLIWVEWCAPGSFAKPGCADDRCQHVVGASGCVLDDPRLWPLGNPGVRPGRVSLDFLGGMRRSLDPTEFAREFLGWHEDADGEGASPVAALRAAWPGRVDPDSRITGRRAFALDIAPDRGSAAIAAAGLRDDAATHLALVEHRKGTTWAVPRLLELARKHDPVAVVVDGGAQASTEIEALVEAGLQKRTTEVPGGRLVILGAADQAKACAGLHDAIAGDSPTAWHRGDPILQTALTGAASRTIGDGGWGFRRMSSDVDITPIVAVAEALHGLVTSPSSWAPMVAYR